MVLPSVDTLVLIRHDLRSRRLTESMLAPKVMSGPTVPNSGSLRHCRTCDRSLRTYQHCPSCSPRDETAGSPSRVMAGYKHGAMRLGISVEEYRAHREAGEKWCTGCRAWESRDRFGPNRSNADGLAGTCRGAWRGR